MKKVLEYIIIAAIAVASILWVVRSTNEAIAGGYYGQGTGNER